MSAADEIAAMLDDVEKRESKLNDWERGFIDSVQTKLGRGRSLTEKEDAKLTEIWERIT